MSRRSGVTLLELMVVMTMIGLVLAAVGTAFSSSLDFRQRQEQARDLIEKKIAFEDRLVETLRMAQVSRSATNEASFFIAESGNSGTIGSLPGGAADTLIFTTFGQRLPVTTLESTDDFETQNERYGPQGGVTEIQIGMVPVGDAASQSGLFIREQRPADGDPTQGGMESVLNPEVTSITFEFWDGEQWLGTWDTRTQQGTRRIPAAVRVSYVLEDDRPGQQHVLVVRLPHSDVTSLDPVTQGGTTGGGAGGP